MRIGATLLLSNQNCVQSYSWSNIRPLGSLQIAMDSLEEYECDEVSIIRPVRAKDSIESFSKDIEAIRLIKTMTPISFGGGIRTLEHLELLRDLPIERLIFSSSFIAKDKKLINKAKNLYGQQAIQCLLPIKIIDQKIFVYYCNEAKLISINKLDLSFINNFANEVVLYDISNDGLRDSFNEQIADSLSNDYSKLVLSGGIGKETIKWAREKGLASVLVDNKVLHREYSINEYKNA
jgi:phosphoribosylformimino-5-aminoimidazole carboxamide ribonucleotide (ProFAR) isomerase